MQQSITFFSETGLYVSQAFLGPLVFLLLPPTYKDNRLALPSSRDIY